MKYLLFYLISLQTFGQDPAAWTVGVMEKAQMMTENAPLLRRLIAGQPKQL
jgi:hypothetical protein